MGAASPRLLAVSDLHVARPQNREIVAGLRAGSDGDWLIVCGDVGERLDDVEWALGVLADRFARVFWVPGNHELWSRDADPPALRGERRYLAIVEACRALGVVTPEDPYVVWPGDGGPVTVVPLFLLYDYSFGPSVRSKEELLRRAEAAGVLCADEVLLRPDPHPTREAWCRARVAQTLERLEALDGARTVLVNHFPMHPGPTRWLRHPEFAPWCGTVETADWHLRFSAEAVVFGHLHIPHTTSYDGVRFEEVSLGYPREWMARARRRPVLRSILPAEERA